MLRNYKTGFTCTGKIRNIHDCQSVIIRSLYPLTWSMGSRTLEPIYLPVHCQDWEHDIVGR